MLIFLSPNKGFVFIVRIVMPPISYFLLCRLYEQSCFLLWYQKENHPFV